MGGEGNSSRTVSSGLDIPKCVRVLLPPSHYVCTSHGQERERERERERGWGEREREEQELAFAFHSRFVLSP